MPHDRTRREFLTLASTAAVGGIAGCATPFGTQVGSTPTETADSEPTTTETTLSDGASVYTQAYRAVIDAVVLVQVHTPRGRGHGSGFAYRSDGYIVTNQHVVEGGTRIDIRFNQGEWRTAEVSGTDVYSDIAVLQVDSMPGYVEPLELVSTDPPIGARVLAIGNPYEFDRTVSAGIVSGVNRSIQVNPNTRGGFSIPDAIQTDAAVNPGNSGGPLVDMNGEVVGIIRSGGGENIGFAVSAALIQRVAPALIEDGEFRHSYMGVSLAPVSPAVAEVNNLEEPRGIMVASVADGGPSDGVLQPRTDTRIVNGTRVPVGGDVIVRLDDQRMDTLDDLSTFLALQTRPGDTIDVTVIRDGERTTVSLTLGERPMPNTT